MAALKLITLEPMPLTHCCSSRTHGNGRVEADHNNDIGGYGFMPTALAEMAVLKLITLEPMAFHPYCSFLTRRLPN
eukprot:11461884-Karenia_brevis.AAC.1